MNDSLNEIGIGIFLVDAWKDVDQVMNDLTRTTHKAKLDDETRNTLAEAATSLAAVGIALKVFATVLLTGIDLAEEIEKLTDQRRKRCEPERQVDPADAGERWDDDY